MEPMDMGGSSSAVATIVRGAEGPPHTFVEVWFEESDDRKCWSATATAGGGAAVIGVPPDTELCTVLRLTRRWLRPRVVVTGGPTTLWFAVVRGGRGDA
jgi:hypothetical protein